MVTFAVDLLTLKLVRVIARGVHTGTLDNLLTNFLHSYPFDAANRLTTSIQSPCVAITTRVQAISLSGPALAGVKNKNLAIANRSRVSCINTNNNAMTLKSGLEVTQCHFNWCHSKAWVRFSIFAFYTL